MKNLSQIMILLFVATIISSACEEYELFKPKSQPIDSVKVDSTALLTWTGEYFIDGCGFFVTIGGQKYRPENEDFINNSFKDVELPFQTEVIIEYKLLDKRSDFYCEEILETGSLPMIEIISIQRSKNVITSEAVLTWNGEYEVDGCGFLITIDSTTYKPHNEEIIDNSFKEIASSGLDVIVDYKLLDIEIAYYCEDVPEQKALKPIQIFSFRRK